MRQTKWTKAIIVAGMLRISPMLLLCLGVPASAFQVRGMIFKKRGAPAHRIRSSGLIPQSDRDAETWLKRAAEAAARGDWKLAADTLNRVIDQHGDRTVSIDEGRHYYSAIRLALEQIAKWPAEGLAAYHILFDPEASRRLEIARRDYDFQALRTIARKYPLTSAGPEAIDLLAGWLIDRGQVSEAIDLLQRLSQWPNTRIPHREILAKLAIAYSLANQRAAAAESLTQLRDLVNDSEPSSPADWGQRVESIQRFFEDLKLQPRQLSHSLSTEAWPYRLGPFWAMGHMPPVNPVITPANEWSVTLPGADRINHRVIRRIMSLRNRPPVWQAVSDGRRLFVTCPAGLMARDLATFDFLWQAFPKFRRRNRQIMTHRIQVGMGQAMNFVGSKDRLDARSTHAFFHEYRGEVSTAFGLVFVIEQDGTPGEQFPSPQGKLPATNVIDPESLTASNSLRAYEAETGRSIWTKGRGGPPNDVLLSAHFFSAPVAAGPYLIVPYARHDDLFMAVLKPDGKVVKQVLIGTGKPDVFPMYGTLQPTVGDGTIYVQTGGGLLVALSEYDFSLRWLTHYDRAKSLTNKPNPGQAFWAANGLVISQPDQWLSSPPMVAGDVVVLAALDSDQLLAFNRSDGTRKWALPRGRHRYIVGADRHQVVVAGQKIAAINLTNGRENWASETLKLTGRPAISGDDIFVPTGNGLIRLDLKTGRPIGDLQPSDDPLGNLLALDGALYSISADRVVKLPDPQQSEALSLARLKHNPDDAEAILSLAWLRMSDAKWQAALDLLDRAESVLERKPTSTAPMSKQSAHRLSHDIQSRIVHQRINALINLAAEASPEKTEPLLVQAGRLAQRPQDKVKAGLALSEYLADREQPLQGFKQAVMLLLDVGDQPMKVESNLRAMSCVVIQERIRRFWREMSSKDRRAAGDFLEHVLQEAAGDHSSDRRIKLADGFGFLPQGARLDLNLAKQAQMRGEHETGIFYLLRAARRAKGKPIELEVLLRLAMAYRFPGEGLPAAPKETADVLRQLADQYAATKMPAGLPAVEGFAPSATVGDFVTQMRETLPTGVFVHDSAMPRILLGHKRLTLLKEILVASGPPYDSASFWDPAHRYDLFAEVVPIQISRQMRGLNLNHRSDVGTYWIHDVEWVMDDLLTLIQKPILDTLSSAIIGRTAVLSTPSQVFAVGLTSGRSMWPPLDMDPMLGKLPQPSVIGVDGMIIAAVDRSTLVAIAARDNARPRWRRRWRSDPLRSLHVVDGSLVAVDQSASKVFVIDPRSGRIRREYWLQADHSAENSDRDVTSANLPVSYSAIVGNAVCLGVAKDVVARDVKTGNPLWTLDLEGEINGFFELDHRYLGISSQPNRFLVVRAATGERVQDIVAEGLTLPPVDAVLDFPERSHLTEQGRLLLFVKTKDTPPEYVLDSYPLSDEQQHWRREVGPSATISRQMLRASPRFVAVVRNGTSPAVNRQRMGKNLPPSDLRSPPQLEIVQKSSGLRIGPRPYIFEEGLLGGQQLRLGARPLNASRTLTDVIVLNHRIIAIAPEGIFILATKEDAKPMN